MKKTAIIAAIAAMAVAGVALAEETKAPAATTPKAPVATTAAPTTPATTPAATMPTTATTTAALTETTVKAKVAGYDAKNPTWANTLKTGLTGKGYKNVMVDAATGAVSFNTTDKNVDPCTAVKAIYPTYTCTK